MNRNSANTLDDISDAVFTELLDRKIVPLSASDSEQSKIKESILTHLQSVLISEHFGNGKASANTIYVNTTLNNLTSIINVPRKNRDIYSLTGDEIKEAVKAGWGKVVDKSESIKTRIPPWKIFLEDLNTDKVDRGVGVR
jgi:hypothetical protein